MRFKFRKKEAVIAWEYIAVFIMAVLAFLVLLTYRLDSGKGDKIVITDSGNPEASQTALSETPVPLPEEQYTAAPDTEDISEDDQDYRIEYVPEAKVNINTANMDELVSLPFIGEVKAKAILEYRERNGPFKTVDELLNVKGIGPKTLEKLKEHITIV